MQSMPTSIEDAEMTDVWILLVGRMYRKKREDDKRRCRAVSWVLYGNDQIQYFIPAVRPLRRLRQDLSNINIFHNSSNATINP